MLRNIIIISPGIFSCHTRCFARADGSCRLPVAFCPCCHTIGAFPYQAISANTSFGSCALCMDQLLPSWFHQKCRETRVRTYWSKSCLSGTKWEPHSVPQEQKALVFRQHCPVTWVKRRGRTAKASVFCPTGTPLAPQSAICVGMYVHLEMNPSYLEASRGHSSYFGTRELLYSSRNILLLR